MIKNIDGIAAKHAVWSLSTVDAPDGKSQRHQQQRARDYRRC
jgi:hypothetical protein